MTFVLMYYHTFLEIMKTNHELYLNVLTSRFFFIFFYNYETFREKKYILVIFLKQSRTKNDAL